LDIDDFKTKKWDTESNEWKQLKRGTKDFYLSQNEEIDGFDEVQLLMDEKESRPAPNYQKQEKFVIYLSFCANICLLIALVLAVVFSGAISIIASLVDSSLDFFSALIIVFTARAKGKVNFYKYPQVNLVFDFLFFFLSQTQLKIKREKKDLNQLES